jgi:hypothetical protein
MPDFGRLNSDVGEDEGPGDNAGDGYKPPRMRASRAAIGSLLGLLLLVNLSMSLYQLPLHRVIERRLCREYYADQDPTMIDPGGNVSEDLCKVDFVQRELAWIQGAMETAWIVGGQCIQLSGPLTLLIDDTAGRLCHDDPAWLHG